MRRLSVFLVFPFLVLGLLYFLLTLQINAWSNVPGYILKVNRLQFVQFLIKNNYYKGEGLWKVANITLTDERQKFMPVTKDLQQPPFQSVAINNNQKEMTILAHYDSSVLEELLSYSQDGQERINRDILAYICVAQSETKTGLFDRDECYQKAKDYLASNSGMIFSLERKPVKTGFGIVGTAHAAGVYRTG